MTLEVEERPRFVTGGYGRHRRQWVKVIYQSYGPANGPGPQMIPVLQMIPKLDRKRSQDRKSFLQMVSQKIENGVDSMNSLTMDAYFL